jgi:hypothetical protein
MKTVTEVMRMISPAPRPQALACDGTTLWMGSIDTCRMYEIDATHWTVRSEEKAPGKPWGTTVMGDELRVVCGEGNEDSRVIRKFIPGHGFKNQGSIPCPDDTGSHLSYDGDLLYVSQWYNKRIISLDEDGNVGSVVEAPRGIAGHCVYEGLFYVLGTDDEDSDEYYITRIDARNGSTKIDDIARVPFQGRALAFDGQRFWSNHRERNEIVAFTI